MRNCAAKTLLNPTLWLTAIVIWVITLFLLSSQSDPMPETGYEIPHIDKILHFGYFMGGGFICTTLILLKKQDRLTFAWRYLLPISIFAIIGALDEFRQSFIPERTGNDPMDWLADVLGATTGCIIANYGHCILLSLARQIGKKAK